MVWATEALWTWEVYERLCLDEKMPAVYDRCRPRALTACVDSPSRAKSSKGSEARWTRLGLGCFGASAVTTIATLLILTSMLHAQIAYCTSYPTYLVRSHSHWLSVHNTLPSPSHPLMPADHLPTRASLHRPLSPIKPSATTLLPPLSVYRTQRPPHRLCTRQKCLSASYAGPWQLVARFLYPRHLPTAARRGGKVGRLSRARRVCRVPVLL